LDVKNFFARSWLKKIDEYTLVASVSAEVDMAGLIGRGHNLLSGALPQAAFPESGLSTYGVGTKVHQNLVSVDVDLL
jgi:hypothetical protein